MDVVPMPAPRPRATKFGSIYYPASYSAHMKEIAAKLPQLDAPPLTGELTVSVELVCKPIAKSKFTTPAGDVDNLAKPILDVLTKQGWYADDRQIVSLHIRKRFPAEGEEPHISFQITEPQ